MGPAVGPVLGFLGPTVVVVGHVEPVPAEVDKVLS